MSTEARLLAASCADRKAYDLIKCHLDDSDLTESGRVVLRNVDTYYGRDPSASRVDWEVLSEQVLQGLTNPKHKATFATILQTLQGTPVSALNVAAVLLGAKREAAAAKLSTLLAAGHSDGVMELMDEYRALASASDLDAGKSTDILHAPSLAELDASMAGQAIAIYPLALNKRLRGGLLRGHHMVVFARPEMGKTMFLVNMVHGFFRQGLKVLYIHNEEPERDIISRIYSRVTERTIFEVEADLEGTDALARERGYDNFFIEALHPGTARDVEEAVSAVRPDVVVIDQLRNLGGGKEDNFARQLEKSANAVRQIAGKYNCLAVSSTQAGDSASGKPVLDMGDVDNSNTGIPGACDLMLGIGARQDDLDANRRVLTLCKNKRSGEHGFFPVRVDVALSKVTSMEAA